MSVFTPPFRSHNILFLFLLVRTKYEARDKQHQGRVGTLEKEKNSLHDELTNTVNELTQVSVISCPISDIGDGCMQALFTRLCML